jgi:hypothetical protein
MRRLERITGYGLLGLLLFGVLWLLLPEVSSTREAARPSQCRNNLKLIGLALHHYHDQYGSFPPAFIADEQGRPIHSWRTLLLPFLDDSSLTAAYARYRFDEPWDGPNNSKLHTTGLPLFSCPGDPASAPGLTNYLAVIGPQTAWPGGRPARKEDLSDGLEQTILVVEVVNSGIRWMEPRDLKFDEMSFKLNDPDGRSISSLHTKPGPGDRDYWPWTKTVAYVHILFADGASRRIRADTPAETIRALLTANGGEDVSLEGREP